MKKFLKATNYLLQKGNFVLVYPEESMWWNYRKPRPLQNGAFRFAVKNHIPVIPVFVTMQDSGQIGEDGFPIQLHTVHIKEPIYPDEKLDDKQNIEKMKEENFNIWKNIYESVYGVALKYETENFTVYYNDCDKRYLAKMVNVFEDKHKINNCSFE